MQQVCWSPCNQTGSGAPTPRAAGSPSKTWLLSPEHPRHPGAFADTWPSLYARGPWRHAPGGIAVWCWDRRRHFTRTNGAVACVMIQNRSST